MPVAGKAALAAGSGVRKAQKCIEIHSFRIKTWKVCVNIRLAV
jgi:hypothetical protein